MIPPDRIAKLEATKTSLKVTLGCDCPVEIQAVDQIGLVIDVLDERLPVDVPDQITPPTHYWPEPEGFVRNSQNLAAVAAFRKNLSEGVGRAATQQLLDVAKTIEILGPESSEKPRTHDPIVPVARFRTTSASERAARRDQYTLPEELACPPQNLGDIENWGSASPFTEQLGDIRNSLMGEFDALDNTEALRLARLYVHFAMGAEALATIGTLEQAGYEAQFLKPIAKLLDDADMQKPAIELPTNGCSGTHAIWGALLSSDPEAITEAQAKTITESFSRLPQHLKSILGPKLMARLNQDGKEIAASVVRNSISSHHDTRQTPPLEPADLANLSEPELNDLIAKSNSQTPAALVALLKMKIKQGAPISETSRDVARSFAIQQLGDPVSIELETVLAQDAVLRGDYSEALDTALDPETRVDTSTIVSFAARRLLDSGSDTDLAKFALRLGHDLGAKHLPKNTILTIGKKLQSVGLDELATAFSGRPPEKGAIKPENRQQVLGRDISLSQSFSPPPPTLGAAKTILDASRDTRRQISRILGNSGSSGVQ